MEAACKAASRTAQLLTKDTPQEEVSQMMAVMTSIKEQLSKVCVHVVKYTLCVLIIVRLLCVFHFNQHACLQSGTGKMFAFAEGVPVSITSTGRNGKEHHRLLSSAGKGQSHHQQH